MSRLPIVDNLRIASPCDASWSEMTGDDRARFCGQCDKHVYDLTTMGPEEIVDLIEETEGKFCGRLYKRRDGTVLTEDCPVGWARVVKQARRKTYRAIALAVGLSASAMSLFAFGSSRRDGWFGPDGPVSAVLTSIEEKIDPPVTMGIVAPPESMKPPQVTPEPVEIEMFEMGDIAIEPETDRSR